MYKSGIWRCEDLEKTRTRLGKTRQFSYSLLRMPERPAPADVARFETIIRTVKLSSGVCRTTYAARLDDLDSITAGLLKTLWPKDRALEFHDVGTSDALLSMHWAERLFLDFPQAHVTASDFILYFIEATHPSKKTFILEPDGTPLQCTAPPFVVSLYAKEPAVYPINVVIRAWARRFLNDLRANLSGVRWGKIPDPSPLTSGLWQFRQIPLIHPHAQSYMKSHSFEVIQADAFQPFPRTYDVIRAMNLFQTTAFTREKILEGFRTLLKSLNDNGILIVGKTQETEGRRNDATLFLKEGNRLKVLHRLGRGFEFEDLALGNCR